MRLLVLDLATQLGFCFGDEAGEIEHGTHKLPSTGPDIGAFLGAYRSWLVSAITKSDVKHIVFEMPNLPQNTSLATLRKLYGLCGLTELVARDHGVTVSEANLFDIRRHFVGVCSAPRTITCKPGCKVGRCNGCKNTRRQWIKDKVGAQCRALGFRPADDNAADALALFSFAMSNRVPGFVLAGDEIARAA